MMKNKKIIISTYTFLPDIGGVATNSLTIAEAFQNKGYDVTVVTLTKDTSSIDKRIKVIRNPNLFLLLKLYYSADWILLANLSLKLCWPLAFLNKNTALQHHSSSAFIKNKTNSFKSLLKRTIENKVINKSIHFVNSGFTMKDGGEFFNNLKVYITYPIMQKTSVIKESADIHKNRKGAIFVGRLEPEKGVEFLYSNLDVIKNRLEVNHFTFIGGGSLFNDFKEKSTDNFVIKGAVELDSVYKLMQGAKFVLVPSIWQEPFGMVAAEALASGAVVITSDRGGLPEAVGKVAEQFDLESEQSFIEALENAKLKSKSFLDKNTLSKYQANVNLHLDKFSGENVTAVMINAFLNEEK
ncbi:glycosyltransferase family 4 protein [Pseudoalteromonas sp. AS84]|uniref:glycosyltransferase family 4 protein n=1 Tax=Pseudoalteromonas sp. AS84 TaxID=3135778 RepID=UPI00316EEB2A